MRFSRIVVRFVSAGRARSRSKSLVKQADQPQKEPRPVDYSSLRTLGRIPRTIDDPAIAAFGALAWIGYAIEDPDGAILGTFCLMDSKPHEWTPTDIQLVATLAKAASTEIALRKALAENLEARRVVEDLRRSRAAEDP